MSIWFNQIPLIIFFPFFFLIIFLENINEQDCNSVRNFEKWFTIFPYAAKLCNVHVLSLYTWNNINNNNNKDVNDNYFELLNYLKNKQEIT